MILFRGEKLNKTYLCTWKSFNLENYVFNLLGIKDSGKYRWEVKNETEFL